jgi:hypothetical protein
MGVLVFLGISMPEDLVKVLYMSILVFRENPVNRENRGSDVQKANKCDSFCKFQKFCKIGITDIW